MESLTPLSPLENLQGASPSLESVSGTVTVNEIEPITPSVPTKVKNTEQESKTNKLTKLVQMLIDEKDSLLHDMQKGGSYISDHEIYMASLKRSENYKARPYQYASPSKQILKAKAKPFPSCTHCGFNDHRPDDCRNYPECGICGSYDHFTLGHNHVIHFRGGVLAGSSQSSESLIGVKCSICGRKIPDISYFHVFGYPVFIQNHKDHFGKFNAKADDGYFLGYSFDLINTEGKHEQNVRMIKMITHPTDIQSGNNTEVSGSITESLVPDVPQSHISNQASTSSHLVPQDRWLRDQHIELLNIIGD
ncbi:hypothetical protein Tco_1160196 [Tanacetum coccineum]